MRLAPGALLLLTIGICFGAFLDPAGQTSSNPPLWAYGTDPAAAAHNPPQQPDTAPKHLPGTAATFTEAQIQDRFGPADWFPGDHPQMPAVVAQGRKPD